MSSVRIDLATAVYAHMYMCPGSCHMEQSHFFANLRLQLETCQIYEEKLFSVCFATPLRV